MPIIRLEHPKTRIKLTVARDSHGTCGVLTLPDNRVIIRDLPDAYPNTRCVFELSSNNPNGWVEVL